MITGVILARDEQSRIVDCISSLRPFVSEILLIDMESRDTTVELARPLVSQVLSHPVIANFDAARNLAIEAAHNEWLWFLDADERIPLETGRRVQQLIAERGRQLVAITIPFRSKFAGRWIEHSGWWPGYTMPRVLKRGHFRFGAKLHSGVEFDGPEYRFPPEWKLAIEHYSYDSLAHYVEKFNRYTSTEAQNLLESGTLLDWEQALRAMMRDLWLYYERNQGQQDGFHGWALAWLAGQYRWMSRTKIMDAAFADQPSLPVHPPPSLDAVLDVLRSELVRARNVQPQAPLRIVFRSPLWDPSGFAEDARATIRVLSRLGRPMMLEDLPWSDTVCELPSEQTALFRALLNARRPSGTIGITCTIPSLATPDPDSCLNILRTTFETDRIPADWLPRIAEFDELWLMSTTNRRAFIKGGVAPEKIQVVPGFVDTTLYKPQGARFTLPESLKERFVFLSIFDWQLRKGWDLLLKAYVTTFASEDGAALLLKISRAHGHSLEGIQQQMKDCLREVDVDLEERTDIEVLDRLLETQEMARLYRACDAFVLASRGEGWGRPYMEAMASGLPIIGTAGSGQADFMSPTNSFLIEADEVDVPDDAVREIPVYAGQRWWEPRLESLAECLKQVADDPAAARRVGQNARRHISRHYSLDAAGPRLEECLRRAEQRVVPVTLAPPRADQIQVQWEGEFFAGHSFSNINEQLVQELQVRDRLAIFAKRVIHQPPHEEKSRRSVRIRACLDRPPRDNPHVVVRHAFPPNWTRPPHGRWVHIQPWEFGYLPRAWIPTLQSEVDEVWAPSCYVKQVYLDSGIPAEKVQVVPWGVEPQVYRPDAEPAQLETSKTFRFLFMGGSIARKGCDLALLAYLEEFTTDDDVCLVFKDLGTRTFYRFGNLREEILTAADDSNAPQIEYLEQDMTDQQRASLYAACDCLVAPYRGEGFGLPILEAMACGLAPIVPLGGASDDFVSADTGILLSSCRQECEHDWRLCGPAWELDIDVDELRQRMREVYEDRPGTRQLGAAASHHVRTKFTWAHTAERMEERIIALSQREGSSSVLGRPAENTLTTCILAGNDEQLIADCLARVRPFSEEIVVGLVNSQDRTREVCREYAARIYDLPWCESLSTLRNQLLRRATQDWILSLDAIDTLDDEAMQQLKQAIGEVPDDVLGLGLTLQVTPEKNGFHPPSSLRVFRNRNEISFSGHGCDSVEPSIVKQRGQTVELPVAVGRSALHPHDASLYDADTKYRLLQRDLDEQPGPAVLGELGGWHLRQGNPFHAECYLAEARRLIPVGHALFRPILAQLMAAHLEKGDPHRALEAIQDLLQHDSHDNWALAAQEEILAMIQPGARV